MRRMHFYAATCLVACTLTTPAWAGEEGASEESKPAPKTSTVTATEDVTVTTSKDGLVVTGKKIRLHVPGNGKKGAKTADDKSVVTQHEVRMVLPDGRVLHGKNVDDVLADMPETVRFMVRKQMKDIGWKPQALSDLVVELEEAVEVEEKKEKAEKGKGREGARRRAVWLQGAKRDPQRLQALEMRVARMERALRDIRRHLGNQPQRGEHHPRHPEHGEHGHDAREHGGHGEHGPDRHAGRGPGVDARLERIERMLEQLISMGVARGPKGPGGQQGRRPVSWHDLAPKVRGVPQHRLPNVKFPQPPVPPHAKHWPTPQRPPTPQVRFWKRPEPKDGAEAGTGAEAKRLRMLIEQSRKRVVELEARRRQLEKAIEADGAEK